MFKKVLMVHSRSRSRSKIIYNPKTHMYYRIGADGKIKGVVSKVAKRRRTSSRKYRKKHPRSPITGRYIRRRSSGRIRKIMGRRRMGY